MTTLELIALTCGIMVLLIGGPLAGYGLARMRLRDRSNALDERERRLRAKHVERRRREFEDHTSRIHHPTDSSSAREQELREALESRSLEFEVLKQDKDLEIERLQEEIQKLKNQLGSESLPKRSAGTKSRLPSSVFITPLHTSKSPSYGKPDANEESVPSEPETPPIQSEVPPVIQRNHDQEPDEFQFHWTPPPGQSDIEAEPVHGSSSSGTIPRVPNPNEPEPAPLSEPVQFPDSESASDSGSGSDSGSESESASESASGATQSSASELPSKSPTPLYPMMGIRPVPPRASPSKDSKDKPPASKTEAPTVFPVPPPPPKKSIALDTPGRTASELSAEPPRPPRPGTTGMKMRLPAFQPLSVLLDSSSVIHTRDAGIEAVSGEELDVIRRIVQLPHDEFELLAELGYASLRKLSSLSPAEIRRLTEIFGVPHEHIGGRWVPESRARLAELEAQTSEH